MNKYKNVKKIIFLGLMAISLSNSHDFYATKPENESTSVNTDEIVQAIKNDVAQSFHSLSRDCKNIATKIQALMIKKMGINEKIDFIDKKLDIVDKQLDIIDQKISDSYNWVRKKVLNIVVSLHKEWQEKILEKEKTIKALQETIMEKNQEMDNYVKDMTLIYAEHKINLFGIENAITSLTELQDKQDQMILEYQKRLQKYQAALIGSLVLVVGYGLYQYYNDNSELEA